MYPCSSKTKQAKSCTGQSGTGDFAFLCIVPIHHFEKLEYFLTTHPSLNYQLCENIATLSLSLSLVPDTLKVLSEYLLAHSKSLDSRRAITF